MMINFCSSRSGYTGGYKQQARQQNNLTTASYTTTSQQQQLQQQARLQLVNNNHLQTSAVQPTMLQTIQTQPTIGNNKVTSYEFTSASNPVVMLLIDI